MDRLTKRKDGGCHVMDCENCRRGDCTALYCRNRLKDRLAVIEDILGDNYDLDRLRELVEADREKRCVIFRKGYGMVSFYEKDDEGFVIRTVSGVAPKSDPVVAHFIRRDDSTNEDRVN